MAIHVHATYRAGLIHPDQPLDLPEDSEIDLTVVPIAPENGAASAAEKVVRPPAPRISVEELRERLAKYAVSVQPLPPDFSRADIYRDHD
jgi:hypothetical protein